MVNKFGKTALHLCVEKRLHEAVDYLLYKGANPHILDLTEQDCCDKAKQNGLASKILRFNNCTLRKKQIPLMPNGKYPEMQYQKYYQRQEFGKNMWNSLAHLKKFAKPTEEQYRKSPLKRKMLVSKRSKSFGRLVYIKNKDLRNIASKSDFIGDDELYNNGD